MVESSLIVLVLLVWYSFSVPIPDHHSKPECLKLDTKLSGIKMFPGFFNVLYLNLSTMGIIM